MSRKAEGETEETGEQAIMEERMGEAFASNAQPASSADACTQEELLPDFCLNYLALVDMAVHTVRLSNSAGMVRLLSVVNSLERPVCQVVTRRMGSALFIVAIGCVHLHRQHWPVPQMQARWQDRTGVLHQALSAHHSVQFGQDFGVWIKEWRSSSERSL